MKTIGACMVNGKYFTEIKIKRHSKMYINKKKKPVTVKVE